MWEEHMMQSYSGEEHKKITNFAIYDISGIQTKRAVNTFY